MKMSQRAMGCWIRRADGIRDAKTRMNGATGIRYCIPCMDRRLKAIGREARLAFTCTTSMPIQMYIEVMIFETVKNQADSESYEAKMIRRVI